jgi:hypothetical protein
MRLKGRLEAAAELITRIPYSLPRYAAEITCKPARLPISRQEDSVTVAVFRENRMQPDANHMPPVKRASATKTPQTAARSSFLNLVLNMPLSCTICARQSRRHVGI